MATFAHGWFWHQHDGCRHGQLPDTGHPWARKFQCTRARDLARRSALNIAGRRVLRVGECVLLVAGARPKEGLDEAVAVFLAGRQTFLRIEGRGVTRSIDQATAA
ncbi:hypothetical protein [Roseomonas chloroacetimidivorans]|uniref:hypothetical protein n=1 Tax=Roseomonas chloroacetimidivorans TaxID=1766656 RepID=UPI003C7371FC